MAKEYKLSPERLKELQEELNYLKTVREKEVAELIKEARSYGDLSENSEYDEAKNEQGRLYSRMAEVEEILANCVVIEEEEAEGDYIRMGSTVTVFTRDNRSYTGMMVCNSHSVHVFPDARTLPRNDETMYILLDEPVSNSGRLKSRIAEAAEAYPFTLDIQILKDVDRVLYDKENVVTSDSIILDHCRSWVNLVSLCMKKKEKEGLRVFEV